jgi:putative spermidine/putrescine transport system substrate-binding protein
MYGGNNPLNEFIDHIVAPRADKLGVGIHRVPVSDTGAAVQRVLAERRAGKTSGGSVDAVWINGENFATGKKAGLWLAGDWARDLPNARYLNFADPLVTKDFQVPTGGQESAWMRAAFIFAYDTARTPTPPKTFAELMAYARAHPGRVTYPAPPDFTGSAFVRQVIQRLGSRQKGLAYLERLKPLQYRGGKHFPSSEDALNTLFGNGQVDFAMSYSPYFLSVAVKQGRFPASARPFLIGGGALQNFSFVTIPANAAHPDGARVLADLLLDPAVQLIQADPQHANSPGSPTVLDLAKLAKPERAKFHDAVGGKYVITDYGAPLPELPAGVVPTIEQQWRQRVLAS